LPAFVLRLSHRTDRPMTEDIEILALISSRNDCGKRMFYLFDPIHQPEFGTLSVSQHTDTQQALKQRPVVRPDTGIPQPEMRPLASYENIPCCGLCQA
jgi:hypothetical protein